MNTQISDKEILNVVIGSEIIENNISATDLYAEIIDRDILKCEIVERDLINVTIQYLDGGSSVVLTGGDGIIITDETTISLDTGYTDTLYNALGSVDVVQGNLTGHIEDTNNPHNVTAEQIGALTSENDPIWQSEKASYLQISDADTTYQKLNITDTKANILALTPTAGLVAYATDVERLYIADGTNWIEQPIGGEPRGANPDMGYEQDSDLSGYGKDYVTDKRLVNIVLGGNTREENGALRVDSTQDPDTYEIYLRGIWQTLLYDLTYEHGDFRHTPLTEEIHVYSGNSVKVGLNGRPIIMQYSADMGAYPSALTLTGGDF